MSMAANHICADIAPPQMQLVRVNNAAANQYRVVALGTALDGSQDQLLGILTGTSLGSSSLLELVAAPSGALCTTYSG